jgi:prophage regulatory protein
MKYISDKQLSERFATSRATIWRWVHSRDFPQPVKLSPGCTRWKISDVEDWEKTRGANNE